MKFEPMPKIRRDALTMYITEKLDGTNASVHIVHNDNIEEMSDVQSTAVVGDWWVFTASRKRWIAPGENGGQDNMGFALWVKQNAEEVVKLGVGTHFGEWVGPGIQKNPHELEEKRFFLFNNYRWRQACLAMKEGHDNSFPKCVDVVPYIASLDYSHSVVEETMLKLKEYGSAIGGKPEGIMVYVPVADHYQKVTFENSEGKWNET